MKLVTDLSKLALRSALILSALCLMQVAHAQPLQPEADKKPPLTAEEVDRLIGGPTLVTLHAKDTLPKAVFEQLGQQVGMEFANYPSVWVPERLKVPITVDIERQPFWLAVRPLAAQTNLHLARYVYRPGLTVMPGDDPRLRGVATMQGPFLIVANYLQQTLSLPDVLIGRSTAAPPAEATTEPISHVEPGSLVALAREEFKVVLNVFPDPKLRLIPYGAKFKLDEAVDEKDISLLPDVREFPIEVSQSALNITATLNHPAHIGKRLVRLRGSILVYAITKREVWEVPNILAVKALGKTVASGDSSRRFTINGVKKNGEQYEVEVAITRQDFIAPESISLEERQLNSYLNGETFRSARLLDAKGRHFTFYTYRTAGPQSYTLVFTKTNLSAEDQPAQPAKLVWEVPVEFHQIAVPFEFTNLPLP